MTTQVPARSNPTLGYYILARAHRLYAGIALFVLLVALEVLE
jgi:hypothetical protein